MFIYFVTLAGDLHWKIHRNDPVIGELQSLAGYFFVNPLLYPKLDGGQRSIETKIIGILGEMYIIRTDGLVFGTNQDKIDIESLPIATNLTNIIFLNGQPDIDIAILPNYAEHLTANLRYISRQVDISRNFVSISRSELTELPLLNFPSVNLSVESRLNKYIWDTAIVWKNLLDADAELSHKKMPIYDTLLLDAIHALKEKDYRRALLYSAMSIESLASTKLDEIYLAVIENKDSQHKLRVIELRQGNASIKKDPVFETLFSKSKFAERLHEIPLYLIGKSLLVENENLYQKAVKLYRTRNKIAHIGESPSGEQSYFEMNEDDSLVAINTAIEITKWFGDKADFPLPIHVKFVKIYSPS